MKVPLQCILLCILLCVTALGKGSKETCGTFPERVKEELLRSRMNTERRELERVFRKMAGLAAAEEAKGASRDIGNIAVMEEDPGVVSRRNTFNLNAKTVRFIPAGSGYRVEVAANNYSPQEQLEGQVLSGLGDDDSRPYHLDFDFAFFGRAYRALNVNSDGSLTFEVADASTRERSLGRLLSGLPRIAPFFADLDVTKAGSVSVYSRPDRFVVTWLAVPEYQDFGQSLQNTFQARLLASGVIEFAYQDVNSTGAVVGIAPGQVNGNSSIVSLSNSSGQTFPAAIAERFTTVEELDTVTAAQRFYETHEDAYDYLVFYNSLGITAGAGTVAFEVTVRNQRKGYGDPAIEAGTEYGSARRLQAVLNLGQLAQYPVDPNGILGSRSSSRDTPVTVLAHEAGHLFLAFASVRDPQNPDNLPMLGRQSAHWAFAFNSEASLLEGNRIVDKGAGVSPRFETVAVTEQYSPFDQYLMGFRPPQEVPGLFYVSGTGFNNLFSSPPQVGVAFNGVRRDVSLDEIIAEYGRRTPEASVSQRRFRFGFVLITAKGIEPDSAALARVEAYRARFEEFYGRAAGERAVADATLRRSVRLSTWPAAGVVQGQSMNATLQVAKPAAAALRFGLRTKEGLVEVPATATIAAGQTSVTFAVRGGRAGVDQIEVTPEDGGYEFTEARVQVLAAANALKLEIVSGDGQTNQATGFLPQPVVVKLSDINELPYPGVKVVASGGMVEPSSGVTDEQGQVSFRWRPGSGARLVVTLDGVPAVSVTATAVGKPALQSSGVLNAASFAGGLTSFALQSIFGSNLSGGVTAAPALPWPARVNDVEVLVNGRPQPLVYVSDEQINFYVADNLSGSEAVVVVNTSGGSSGEVRVPVRNPQPGIFFDAASGNGAVLRRGDFLEVYSTGLGAASLVSATIDGAAAEVQFAGLAPGYVGLNQVNVRLPAGASGEVRVRLRAGGIESNEVRVRLTAP